MPFTFSTTSAATGQSKAVPSPPGPSLSVIIPAGPVPPGAGWLARVEEAIAETGSIAEVVVAGSPDQLAALDQLALQGLNDLRCLAVSDTHSSATHISAAIRGASGDLIAVVDPAEPGVVPILAGLLDALRDGADLAIATPQRSGPRRRWALSRLSAASWVTRLALPGVVGSLRAPRSRTFALRRSVVAGRALEPRVSNILVEILASSRFCSVREVPNTHADPAPISLRLLFCRVASEGVALAELAWRTRHFHRFAAFCAVGAGGVVVNLAVLALCREVLAWPLGLSGGIAVAMAIVTNFTFNELWTFADWTAENPGLAARLRRLCQYCAVCGVGGALNVAILTLLTRFAAIHYLVSAIIGIAAATAWNYAANSTVTWRHALGQMRAPSTDS